MRNLLLIFSLMALVSCSDAQSAKKVLENNNLTDITITGYKFFGCGKDDQFHTGFEATSPNGNRVSGVVCKGILKGSTVRFDD